MEVRRKIGDRDDSSKPLRAGRKSMAEPKKILVVDGERDAREGLRKLLTSRGYRVQTAEDGVAGLELAKREADFDAALIDLKVPRMGGLELLEELHKYDENMVLFVIAAFPTIETAVEAMKRGACNYFAKPFSPDGLLREIENGLKKRALTLEAHRRHKERENRLLELTLERSKSRSIIDCMSDGIIVINRDRQIVMINSSAARAIPELEGLPFPVPLKMLPWPDLRALLVETLEAASTPVIVSREIVVRNRTYMVNASPVTDPVGEILGAVAVMRDIAKLKDLENAKSAFVSMVAHEIRNPLTVIQQDLNTLLSGEGGPLTERQRETLNRALVETRFLHKMLSELTVIQSGTISLRREPVDLKGIVEISVKSRLDQAREKGVALRTHYEGFAEFLKVLADKEALESVFTNLIDNAIKYTPRGGHVDVTVEPDGMWARVSVRDDGIGIEEENKEKIFEEFFRVRNETTAEIPGTGLGLTVVKRIVDMHQGSVSVESKPGEGAVFHVYLPAAASEPDAPSAS